MREASKSMAGTLLQRIGVRSADSPGECTVDRLQGKGVFP